MDAKHMIGLIFPSQKCLNNSGKYIEGSIVMSLGNIVLKWSPHTSKTEVLYSHDKAITTINSSTDCKLIVSSDSRNVKIYSSYYKTVTKIIPISNVTHIAINEGGTLLAVSDNKKLSLYLVGIPHDSDRDTMNYSSSNAISVTDISKFAMSGSCIQKLAFSPSGDVIVALLSTPVQVNRLCYFTVDDNTLVTGAIKIDYCKDDKGNIVNCSDFDVCHSTGMWVAGSGNKLMIIENGYVLREVPVGGVGSQIVGTAQNDNKSQTTIKDDVCGNGGKKDQRGTYGYANITSVSSSCGLVVVGTDSPIVVVFDIKSGRELFSIGKPTQLCCALHQTVTQSMEINVEYVRKIMATYHETEEGTKNIVYIEYGCGLCVCYDLETRSIINFLTSFRRENEMSYGLIRKVSTSKITSSPKRNSQVSDAPTKSIDTPNSFAPISSTPVLSSFACSQIPIDGVFCLLSDNIERMLFVLMKRGEIVYTSKILYEKLVPGWDTSRVPGITCMCTSLDSGCSFVGFSNGVISSFKPNVQGYLNKVHNINEPIRSMSCIVGIPERVCVLTTTNMIMLSLDMRVTTIIPISSIMSCPHLQKQNNASQIPSATTSADKGQTLNLKYQFLNSSLYSGQRLCCVHCGDYITRIIIYNQGIPDGIVVMCLPPSGFDVMQLVTGDSNIEEIVPHPSRRLLLYLSNKGPNKLLSLSLRDTMTLERIGEQKQLPMCGGVAYPLSIDNTGMYVVVSGYELDGVTGILSIVECGTGEVVEVVSGVPALLGAKWIGDENMPHILAVCLDGSAFTYIPDESVTSNIRHARSLSTGSIEGLWARFKVPDWVSTSRTDDVT